MPDSVDESPDERYALNLPSLLIPYWDPGERGPTDPGDRGDVRPLPADIIPYLCEGIMTDSPYKPGNPLTVTVSVRNWGGGVVGSNATVRVWWEDLATSFAGMTASNLIGVKAVEVAPRGDTKTSEPMTYTFPILSPPHICLIACVEHSRDVPPKTQAPPYSLIPLPGIERHWAQHNLTYVEPDSGGTIKLPFMASNPFLGESEFLIEARPFTPEKLDRLTRTVHAEPIETEARLEINTVRDLRNMQSQRRSGESQSVVLDGGSRTAMHLGGQLSRVPQEGQFAAIELLQRRTDDDYTVGGIAVIVLAPDPERR
ncbi:hypothetical protein [Nocardia fluminea]|uniref:hypothetical protein n=1 Tax=Nocardia fluminea TaxID=134984 RepID=UPI0036675992